jgi:hypothetical protein
MLSWFKSEINMIDDIKKAIRVETERIRMEEKFYVESIFKHQQSDLTASQKLDPSNRTDSAPNEA